MFVFVATAFAATLIGWPCQRLNWGWRNVWSTCSINSFAPVASTAAEVLATQVPTFFRVAGATTLTPSGATSQFQLNPNGVFTPANVGVTNPKILCDWAPSTGAGATANMRNRCRRAIDAYGALVKTCTMVPALTKIAGASASPNTPDWAPSIGHQPHVLNVQGLTHNAQFCLLPTGVNTPAQLNTPSNTCPGLLGWFTVVFNACGFSNAPGMTPANLALSTPIVGAGALAYFPFSSVGVVNTASGQLPNVIPTGNTISPITGAGYFCGVPNIATQTLTPGMWNQGGPIFRTSRCRKALDQFGRTAQRCHASTIGGASGPSQAGGYSDPLRLLAVGNVANGVSASPSGLNVWSPACNG